MFLPQKSSLLTPLLSAAKILTVRSFASSSVSGSVGERESVTTRAPGEAVYEACHGWLAEHDLGFNRVREPLLPMQQIPVLVEDKKRVRASKST